MSSLSRFYFYLILQKPRTTLLLLVSLMLVFAWHSLNFRLDASSDSLVLENDQDLKFYRSIEKQYGADDFLFITYTPVGDLFSEEVKKDIRVLSDKLAKIDTVKSVITILDVPLIESPPVTLSDIQEKILTLESEETNQQLARQELINSPLYKNLLISSDGSMTAMQVNFKRDERFHDLLEQRNQLRELKLERPLSFDEKQQLKVVSYQFDLYNASYQAQQSKDIITVRQIMDEHRENASLFLGGLPMITSDSIDYIRHDLMTFGIGVLIFLIILLAIIFQQMRWIILPMLCCAASGIFMVGFLGWVNWPVTVVSSNFISLMLIITLSLMVHLIVRYRELQDEHATADHSELIRQMVSSKVQPSFFTALTTIVAFASLIVSGIRPVIDFGWMMTIGISMSFIIAFTLFPAMLMLLSPTQRTFKGDMTSTLTTYFAQVIQRFDKRVVIIFMIVSVLSAIGMSKLSVENRFIDYYKEHTEIYQGMILIDEKMGGTTPLDVVIDAPAEFFQQDEAVEEEGLFDDFDLGFDLDFDLDEDAGITSTSYWFNNSRLPKVKTIHQYLDGLSETGKVLSISTSLDLLRSLDEDVVMDDFFLSILYKRVPEDIKQSLFKPYMSEDGNQLRFTIRVYESDPNLKRDALLEKIQHHLTNEMGLADEQVHLTGMLVLYNNLLQSLFKSQILTISVVFIAILFMFFISFRNFKMASLAIVPNIIAASTVLGIMGWLRIPLDIMTITIAAICIGIAVDDTIHYVHRFNVEFKKDNNYWGAIKRSHNSIGRAMYYTTITITLGFSILALSNFIPSIYFGLLTGFSMIMALLANLTLLPVLIVWLKPNGR
ncbi:Exporter protein, RND family [hydrothermal vent metagenome]|uniref:Exporter protein, RND family n=1 Tax=hydrothermal vent metagenome TaxID=652676 RepID=A0A3B0W7U4_9ZZZZ